MRAAHDRLADKSPGGNRVTKKKPPNPHGREGDKLKIDLPFDEAVKAALKTRPPKDSGKRKEN